MRTDKDDMYNLIAQYNGDMRKALNMLQLWLLSGGGDSQKNRAIKQPDTGSKKTPLPVDENSCSQDALRRNSQSEDMLAKGSVDDKDDDDDDFVSIKPLTLRRKPILFDEDSNSVPTPVSLEKTSDEKADENTTEGEKLPVVHTSVASHLQGYSKGQFENVMEILKRLTQVCSCVLINTNSLWQSRCH